MRTVQLSRRTFLAAALFSAAAARAFAHAKLVRSIPADKSRVEAAPKSVEFWFNERLEAEFSEVKVFPAAQLSSKDRENLVRSVRLDPKDRTHLIADLKPLPPGKYLAEYRVLSRDSHTAPGRIGFSVGAK